MRCARPLYDVHSSVKPSIFEAVGTDSTALAFKIGHDRGSNKGPQLVSTTFGCPTISRDDIQLQHELLPQAWYRDGAVRL